MGHAVFKAARGPKALWAAPDGGHNDLAAHGALERTIAFALSLRAGSVFQDEAEAGADADVGSRATALPAQPRREACEGAGRRGIMANVRRGLHHAEGIGFVVLMAFWSHAAARKARSMRKQQAAKNPSPLRDAINATLDERRRNGGLGPAVGPGVDISALFAPYVAKGMTVAEATEALRSANILVRHAQSAGEGRQSILQASAELEATASTTTDVAVIVILETDGNGAERVAQVKSALMWAAL